MIGNKISKYVVFDILRNKWLITYTVFLLCISSGLIYFSHDTTKSVISILNVVLLLVPLVSIVFGTIHFYNSREFIEMLLSQPVKRSNIFWAEYLGLSVSLSLGFLIGVILPLSFYGVSAILIYLAITGVFLSFIFVAISMLTAVSYDEKVRGIGLSFFIWFYFAILFDGIVLLIYVLFNDYPLEKIVILLTSLNPIDLSRIMILLKLDISAMMGYSGATFHKFFGSMIGTISSLCMLMLWTAAPVFLALRKFRKKNF